MKRNGPFAYAMLVKIITTLVLTIINGLIKRKK